MDLLLAFLEEDDEGEDERAAGGGGLQTERRELRDSRGTEQEGRSHSTPSPSLRAARSFSLRSISRQEKPVSSLPPRRLKGRASSAGEGASSGLLLPPTPRSAPRVGTTSRRSPLLPLPRDFLADTHLRDGQAGNSAGSDEREEDEEDSVTKLADEVLQEFESIVLPGIQNHDRPPSRLRGIPSPPSSATSSSPDLTQTQPPGPSEDISIRAELAASREYISRLQEELRQVTAVVKTLAAQESQPAMRPTHRVRKPSPPQNEDVLTVAQHVLSLISSSSMPPEELESIALALNFTRRMDSLVWKLADEGRRDEDVFKAHNIQALSDRVSRWEEVVRGRSV